VQLHEVAARAVMVDDRRGLPVVRGEALVDRARPVVGPPLFGCAPQQALARNVVVEREQQDDRERLADLVEQRVERLGLDNRARIAVEDEATAAGLQQLLADERDRDLVGNERALGEQRLDLLAELRTGCDRSPIEVARRDVADLELLRDPLRLRSLARTLRSQDEDVYRRNPS
jgi:hypothetical protein